MTIYGMPPDDPSSLIPENTIDARSNVDNEPEVVVLDEETDDVGEG